MGVQGLGVAGLEAYMRFGAFRLFLGPWDSRFVINGVVKAWLGAILRPLYQLHPIGCLAHPGSHA